MESIEEIGKHNGFCWKCKKIQFNWILSSDASDQSATKPPVPFAVPIKTIWRVCSCLEIGFFLSLNLPIESLVYCIQRKTIKKTSPKNESAKKNSPHNLNDLFISILIEQMHSQIEKQTINSPSNAVCVDVRKKALGCMIKLSETKENSFKSIFWHKR